VESGRAGRRKQKSTAYRGRREIWSSWGAEREKELEW